MKVVCITGNWNKSTIFLPTDNPKKDQICLVVAHKMFPAFGLCYKIKGYEKNGFYTAKDFVPLDDYLDQFTANLVEDLENCQLVEA